LLFRLCGRGTSPSSLPVPLWPRLRPGRKWKWCLPSSLVGAVVALSPFASPNLDRKLFFLVSGCLIAASSNLMSSKGAGSAASGRSNVLLLRVDRVGKREAGLESREEREVKLSPCRIGDRPEMSCNIYQSCLAIIKCEYAQMNVCMSRMILGIL
jgi:hypothetical protein